MPRTNVAIIVGEPLSPFKRLSFFTDANLYEYDTIIFDPESVRKELSTLGGGPYPEETYEAYLMRFHQLAEWVNDGHTLICLARNQFTIQFFSNIGGIRDLVQTQIGTMPLFGDLTFQNATGSRVEFCGPASTEALLKPFIDKLRYQTIVDAPTGTPLLRVQTRPEIESQLVGSISSFGEGKIICMPLISGNSEHTKDYFTALIDLPNRLTANATNLPSWVDSFQTEAERAEVAAINSAEQEISKLKHDVSVIQDSLAQARSLKALFAGTGLEFVEAVTESLIELGLNCVDGPHPRADLLATDGKRLLAIEAKGLDGSARERNFRQVERWKAEANSAASLSVEDCNSDPDLRRYREQLEQLGWPSGNSIDCKGLMIIGTFRSTPLLERQVEDFPAGVLRMLPLSGVCAMTGLQLFTLTILSRKDPSIKATFVETLFNTAGLLPLGSNWQDALAADDKRA